MCDPAWEECGPAPDSTEENYDDTEMMEEETEADPAALFKLLWGPANISTLITTFFVYKWYHKDWVDDCETTPADYGQSAAADCAAFFQGTRGITDDDSTMKRYTVL